MKKILFLTVLSLSLFACSNSEDVKQKKENSETKVESAISVDDLLANKAEYTGKEVVFKGTVDHVCKHSGKRAFVFGSKEDLRIKIEAGDKIKGFDAELIGSEIEVKGTLVETRLDDKYIAKLEDDLSKKMNEGVHVDGEEHHEGGDSDKHEEGDKKSEIEQKRNQIDNLKKKIAESEKGYISNYYIDGISYKTIE